MIPFPPMRACRSSTSSPHAFALVYSIEPQ